jgi:photosystem II CP47 chlorophyll apoprotein
MSNDEAWSTLPLRLPFYNYIGLNPTDSLLRTTGPMINDSISVALGWFGHADFQAADDIGIIRADLPLCKAESKYSPSYSVWAQTLWASGTHFV